jgi:hypothetical protein
VRATCAIAGNLGKELLLFCNPSDPGAGSGRRSPWLLYAAGRPSAISGVSARSYDCASVIPVVASKVSKYGGRHYLRLAKQGSHPRVSSTPIQSSWPLRAFDSRFPDRRRQPARGRAGLGRRLLDNLLEQDQHGVAWLQTTDRHPSPTAVRAHRLDGTRTQPDAPNGVLGLVMVHRRG